MVGNYLNGVRLHGLEGRGEDRSLKLLGRLELRGDGGLHIGKGWDYLA
jgi:hypothetical protein